MTTLFQWGSPLRRTIARSAIAIAAILWFTSLEFPPQCCAQATVPTAATASDRPNILLIVSDDQGYPDLGCIGSKPIRTPNLDRLAEQGVRLTQFYVAWPACTPSRSAILTGRYPQRNGLYDMVRNDMVNYAHQYQWEEYLVSPEMTLGLDPKEITLADQLRKAGYRCGVFGKWDMGQARRYLPLQRGFDAFYGHGNNGIDYFTHERYGVHSIFRDNDRTKDDVGVYATELFTREALRFLEQTPAEKPWFLYLPYNAPHSASAFGSDSTPGSRGKDRVGVQAPEEDVQPYLEIGVPPPLANYYGAVTHMDTQIGRILSAIRERGELDNTFVIFFSDNGGSGNGGNAPLRGSKSQMFEGGLRVPAIVSWPAKLPAGVVSDAWLTSLELFPTLSEIAGVGIDDGLVLDGFDMLPVLEGKIDSPRNEMVWKRRGDVAIRVGKWKWIDSQRGGGLFNLSTDVGETKDLTERRPEVAKRLQNRLGQWLEEMDRAEPRGPFRDY